MPYNNFTQMPVWQLALEIVEDVISLQISFQKEKTTISAVN